MVRKIDVKYGQSLADIAIQVYGDIEGMVDLMRDNNLTSVSQEVQGMKLLIDEDKIRNQQVVAFYERSSIKPNTGSDLYVPPTPNVFDNTFSSTFN